jgi:hypothetical protein
MAKSLLCLTETNPASFLTSGEYTVRPAQSIGAASSSLIASGIGKTKCSWARMAVEYPPCVWVPCDMVSVHSYVQKMQTYIGIFRVVSIDNLVAAEWSMNYQT